METFDDILDAVRVSAASTDPMFARKGRDAAGLTAEIDASDWRDNGVLKTITDPVQRERVAEKMQRGVFERRKAVQEYEVQQLLDWSRAEVGRRIGRNGAEIAADFGRRLDLLTSQWNSPDSVAGRAWLAEQYKDDPNFTMPTVADAPGFAAMVDEFGAVSQKMYGDAFAAYKGVGYSDAEAEAKAAGAMRSAVVGSLQGFAENGDETRGRFVDSVLGKYGNAESRFVPDDVVDNDGKPMLDKDGKRLVAKDKDGKPMVHFDPAGGLWMDDNDVAKLSDVRARADAARARSAQAEEQIARANAKAQEDALKAEAVSLRAIGDSLIPADSSAIDEKKINGILDRLTKIGMLGVSEANSAYEHIISAMSEHNKIKAEVDSTNRSEDELERMWDEFDVKFQSTLLGKSFGADLTGIKIDSKKKMILEIERAYTNGTIKDDPKSDTSVWGRRLRELKTGHYEDNLNEMAAALKKSGITVDRKSAAKLAGSDKGLGDIFSSWGGETPSIESVLSVDEDGIISTRAQAIPFIWDDGSSKWKISGSTMRSILDELSRNWQSEALDPSPEVLHGIISRVLKQSRQRERSWLFFSNEYIDPQRSVDKVKEITSTDLQGDLTFSQLKAKTTSTRAK